MGYWGMALTLDDTNNFTLKIELNKKMLACLFFKNIYINMEHNKKNKLPYCRCC